MKETKDDKIIHADTAFISVGMFEMGVTQQEYALLAVVRVHRRTVAW